MSFAPLNRQRPSCETRLFFQTPDAVSFAGPSRRGSLHFVLIPQFSLSHLSSALCDADGAVCEVHGARLPANSRFAHLDCFVGFGCRKEAVAAASDAGSERSVHSSVHSSANSTGTAAASGTEPITNADTAAAAAAAARLAELEAELAATQAEKESLTAKVSELEANSDKFQTEAHVLRKELRAVKKAKGMSMHDIVAYLPSSRQQFHQMLLASQKNDVPVIMEDVRHIMDGVR